MDHDSVSADTLANDERVKTVTGSHDYSSPGVTIISLDYGLI